MELTEFEELDPERVDAVGNPANGVPFLMLKSLEKASDPSDKERRKMARSGVAMPDGSYPIPDVEHLHAAIHAVGRGNANHDAIRRHIIKRAKALGHTDAIPDNWSADGSLKKETDMDAEKAAPSQASAQSEAHTPDPSAAAHQTAAMHPDNGPKPGDNAQAGGFEKPAMSGFGDPEADDEGFGDTAPDKSLPMGEAQSQTASLHKAGSADGRGDIAGPEGDKDLKDAEGEEHQTDEVHSKKHIEMDNPALGKGGDADQSPGSQKWEEKDAAIIAQAVDLLQQVGAREKAEAGAAKAGRRLSGKSEQKIQAAIQALRDLLDNVETSDSVSKEIEDMPSDELRKLIRDELTAARRDDRKAKKAKAAKKAKKAAKGAEAPQAPAVDLDAIAKAFADQSAEAFKSAVKPLEERLATVENQPAPMGAMLNAAGLEGQPVATSLRGQAPEGAAKEMADLRERFEKATDPTEKAKLGNEISLRALKAFENGRRAGWAS